MADSTQSSGGYDPIKMLRDYLNDNPKTPPYFRNFLINRLGDQITFYDKRSGQYKKQWEKNRKIVIVLSASIPFLAGLLDQFEDGFLSIDLNLLLKLAIGMAGVAIAIIEGLNALHKGQELYVEYRETAEQLRQEFSYFLGNAGEYSGAGNEAFGKLVAKVEAIMSTQNNKWAEVARSTERAAMSDNIAQVVEEHLRKYNFQRPAAPAPPPPAVEEEDSTVEAPPALPDDTAIAPPPPTDEALDEEMPEDEGEGEVKG